MAPTVKTSTPARGKTRIYLCKACGIRHVTPTSANCPHTKRPKPIAPKTIGKRRGRKPLNRRPASPTSVSSDFLLPPGGTVRRIDTSPSRANSSSEDDMEIDEFLQVSQVRPHSAEIAGPSTQSLDQSGTDVGRPPVPTPRCSTLRRQSPIPETRGETMLLVDQMRSMQDENRRELHRIELQVQADRRAMEDSIRQLSERVITSATANVADSSRADQSWSR